MDVVLYTYGSLCLRDVMCFELRIVLCSAKLDMEHMFYPLLM